MPLGLTPALYGLLAVGVSAPLEPMMKPNTQPGLAVLVGVPPGLYAYESYAET